MILKNKNNIIAEKVKEAKSFGDRLIGLMGKSELKGYDALLIKPCNQIHTFFMLMSIDVVFLDKNLKVIKVVRDLRPWRLSWMYFRATQVLEMKAGTLTTDIKEGDILEAHV